MTRTVYTIPPDIPFLRALAQGIVDQAGGFTPDLAKYLVLLPTRRACRDLRDTFLELSDGKPLLLPCMQPLGDIDQEELDLRLGGLHDAATIPDIPPAIPALKRLFLLAQLIAARSPETSHEQALKLASSLATLIDQVHTEDLDFSKLAEIVPGALSRHWQQTLEFLEIATTHWPLILEQQGQIDPADRRNRLMKALAESWQHAPLSTPVIAAGSTGSIPATARLLSAVSALPQGSLILPGLDKDLDSLSWDTLIDTHPQATMRSLLNHMGIRRDQVEIWPVAKTSETLRPWLGRELMRPAETVSEWVHLKEKAAQLSETLSTISVIETATQSEEAQTIAVIMRATLEEPGKRAALVTPDRALARRVCAALKKWDIPVDDSAGSSLALSPAGHLLDCLLICILENFSPPSLLNLLKHQRVKLANSILIGDFEIEICRGPRPAKGLNSLHLRCQDLKTPRPDLEALLTDIAKIFEPLSALASGFHPVQSYLTAVSTIAEKLGNNTDVWLYEDGQAASLLLSETMDHAGLLPELDLVTMQGVLRQLMQAVPVRHPVLHPRLVILGQLEARMLQTDVMILGSLNEGSWPADPAHDPWMSRPMRQSFGLPSPERSIGLAAHDFVQSLCSPRVVLTRSEKVDGSPTVPSRWLQRLTTMLGAANLELPRNHTYSAWARLLQENGGVMQPAACPAPKPPVTRRPLTLSVTWIERWIRNPYQIYVRKILKLSPLTPLDQEASSAERGTVVHAILRDFIATYPDHLPPSAHDEFIRLARRHIDHLETDPAEREYWWPRLEKLAKWFIDNEKDWRRHARPWKQETHGEFKIPLERGQFTLFAKADRIDRLKDNSVAIIDYKTGTPPSQPDVISGRHSQMPLEGLILRRGGFDPDITKVASLNFWKLLGGQESGTIKALKDVDQLIDLAEAGLEKLVRGYEDPEMPYVALATLKNPMFDEDRAIAHLARTAEWSSDDAEEQETS